MLQFRNACKQDSKSFQISRESWESAATTGNRLCGVASGRQKKGELNCECLTHVGRMVLPYVK